MRKATPPGESCGCSLPRGPESLRTLWRLRSRVASASWWCLGQVCTPTAMSDMGANIVPTTTVVFPARVPPVPSPAELRQRPKTAGGGRAAPAALGVDDTKRRGNLPCPSANARADDSWKCGKSAVRSLALVFSFLSLAFVLFAGNLCARLRMDVTYSELCSIPAWRGGRTRQSPHSCCFRPLRHWPASLPRRRMQYCPPMAHASW